MTSSGTPAAGRYRIEAALGKGGMGHVYRATDNRLGRLVALKMMTFDGIVDTRELEQSRARFRREAEAGARIHHPNVIALFDVGETEGGVPFIAMELAEGQPLSEAIATRAPRLDVCLGWLLAIARGVAAAHRVGVVHRDLKPSNVVIGGGDVVKVLDFGVARMTGTSTITAAGFQPGTRLYMSPEQNRGARVDARSDQYAWGVVAWEVLTGKRPEQLSSGEVALPGAKAIPPWLVAIARRTLAKAPGERFDTMDGVVSALAAGAWPRARRRRAPFLLACGATIAGGLALAAAWRARPPKEVRDARPLPSASATVPDFDSGPVADIPDAAEDARQDPRASRSGTMLGATIVCCDGLAPSTCEDVRRRVLEVAAPCASVMPAYGGIGCDVDVHVEVDEALHRRTTYISGTGRKCPETPYPACLKPRIESPRFDAPDASTDAAPRKVCLTMWRR